jgi:hypothetical protein
MARFYTDVFYKIETEDGVYYAHKQVWEDPEADILRDVWCGESEMKELFTGKTINIYLDGPKVPNSEYRLIKMYIGDALYYVGEAHERVEFSTEYRNIKYNPVAASIIEEEIKKRYKNKEEAIRDVNERLNNRVRINREKDNEQKIIEARKAYSRQLEQEKNDPATQRLKNLMP